MAQYESWTWYILFQVGNEVATIYGSPRVEDVIEIGEELIEYELIDKFTVARQKFDGYRANNVNEIEKWFNNSIHGHNVKLGQTVWESLQYRKTKEMQKDASRNPAE